MDEFEAIEINTSDSTIFLKRLGNGPPLLLLHGFPQTHLMWRHVAPLMAENFTVICPDLPGYGQSACPPTDAGHSPYSKRAMANAMAEVIKQSGFKECSVAGHDRGARVAYRMALDHPQMVKRLAVLDIIPTGEVWNRTGKRLIDFWPWSLLSQPYPLPEQLMMAAPEAVVENAFKEWGTKPEIFPEEVKKIYVDMLRDADHVHAICEEFRAAAGVDHEHDLQERNRITCPVLALWAAGGAVDTWYSDAGGPLAIWRNWANDVQGHAIDGGHFFPEANPQETALQLSKFFM